MGAHLEQRVHQPSHTRDMGDAGQAPPTAASDQLRSSRAVLRRVIPAPDGSKETPSACSVKPSSLPVESGTASMLHTTSSVAGTTSGLGNSLTSSTSSSRTPAANTPKVPIEWKLTSRLAFHVPAARSGLGNPSTTLKWLKLPPPSTCEELNLPSPAIVTWWDTPAMVAWLRAENVNSI